MIIQKSRHGLVRPLLKHRIDLMLVWSEAESDYVHCSRWQLNHFFRVSHHNSLQHAETLFSCNSNTKNSLDQVVDSSYLLRLERFGHTISPSNVVTEWILMKKLQNS